MQRAHEHGVVHALLIEPDRGLAQQTAELLRLGWGGRLVITQAESLGDAHPALLSGAIGVIVVGAERQLDTLDQARIAAPSVPVVVLAPAYSDEQAALALRAGAQDYLSTDQLSSSGLGRAVAHALQRKRSEASLAQRALQDPLTGLPNRTLFIDRVGVALDRARRSGGVTAVLFLDVDGFKEINDTLGHSAGDEVLKVMASRLLTVLRPMDTVARFGGDEFTFLFEGLAAPGEAAAIADRVRAAASNPITLDGLHRQLSVSIGVATTADPTISPEMLIHDADLAMYESKRRSAQAASPADPAPPTGPDLTDQPAAAPPPAAVPAPAPPPPPTIPPVPVPQAPVAGVPLRAVPPLAPADELRAAIERGEVHAAYQPRYILNGSNVLTGFEALARWEHPRRGTIPAAEFIPLAEQAGIATHIGKIVLEQALGLLGRLRTTHPALTVSINLCADQLTDTGLASALAVVEAAQVQPGSVSLEIPERAVSDDPELARRAARVLRAAGVRVAVDDYGTGDVSLSSLRTLNADELKIHESFVRELDHNAHSGVVRAVVDLGHALGMTVVAEGVETEFELGELRTLGCDLAQGYLLSRPLRAAQLEQLVLAG